MYWYPLYSFVRRRGYDEHEALDLTQDFFVHLLAPDYVKRADPARGRFRGFLFTSMRNFLAHDRERRSAQKRGGGVCPISLDAGTAEERFSREPVELGLTPEEAYERAWALSVIDRVLAELESEYVASGRGALFSHLRNVVWGDSEENYEAVAAAVGINLSALRVSVHRLRKQVRDRLRQAVAQTVARQEETEDELRVLLAALQPGRKTSL